MKHKDPNVTAVSGQIRSDSYRKLNKWFASVPAMHGMMLNPAMVSPGNGVPSKSKSRMRMTKADCDINQCSIAKTAMMGMPYFRGIEMKKLSRWMPWGCDTRKVLRPWPKLTHSRASSWQLRIALNAK
jgi:ribosomal protein L34E